MTSSRDAILKKLRAARQPFPAAPPRPKTYLPVTHLDDAAPESLLQRFTGELERLDGEVFVVEGDDAARDQVLALLKTHDASRVLAWEYQYIPIDGLEQALAEAGITAIHPDIHGDTRDGALNQYETVPVGLTGADAAFAATGTFVVNAAPGKDRIPTVLPRVHIVVITLDQIVPRLESWVANQRHNDLALIRNSSNLCFISGPSRTADIEKNLVLGMHGPEEVQVVIKR